MKIELRDKVVYLDGVPAFKMLPGGMKDPLTPLGWNDYRANEEAVDEWIEYQLRPQSH